MIIILQYVFRNKGMLRHIAEAALLDTLNKG